MANEMTIAGLIRDLQRLLDLGKLSPDGKVWIGEQYPYSAHMYQVGSWMTDEQPVVPEHTCSINDCTCDQDPDATYETGYECPVHNCLGCEAEDCPLEGNIYFMMGDQHPLQDGLVDVEFI